jgi:hypothetical protein
MKGRFKYQVWSEVHYRWRTVYVLIDKVRENHALLRQHGFRCRIAGAPT